MALHEGTEFVKGQVKDMNFDSYTPPRIGDVPALEIEFIDNIEAPVGLGEASGSRAVTERGLRMRRVRATAKQGRMVETFLVESWPEHLRRHERVTNAAMQDAVLRFLIDGLPKLAHLIAAEPHQPT